MPPYEPIFTAADCKFTLSTPHDVACGFLEVPENRDDLAANGAASGRTVRLHVAIFASESSSPLSTIVYLEGGPGGDALETLPYTFEDNFAPLLANHELVIFDQRGTGYSEPSLACPESEELMLSTLDEDLDSEQSKGLLLEMVTACRDRLRGEGVDLAAYNSRENAADVDDLRRVLGHTQWDLYGISYGTRLAQTVMRDFPDGVRSVVLDSTYPLSADLTVDTIANMDRAFDTFFAGCAADAACGEAYPDLETRFFALADTLNATPILVPVLHVFTGQQLEALVDGETMIEVLFQSLYSEELIVQLPKLIADVEQGHHTALSTLLSNFLISEEFVSAGMNLSVQCYEEVAFGTAAAAETAVSAYPQLAETFAVGTNTGPFAYTVCATWDVGSAPAVENEAIRSDLPTLVLAGEYDPITPPAWGQLVATNLPHATYLEFPGLGHAVSTAGDCPQGITLAFFADPTAAPDASCIANMGSPAFVVGSENADIVLEPFSETTPFAMSGVIPAGWEQAGPGTYVRGASILDQTLIIQVAAPAAPGLTADVFTSSLLNSLGVEELGESVGTFVDNGRSWSLYTATVQGHLLDLATAETADGLFMVAMISTEEEREGLITAVFQPALTALTLNP